MRTALAYLMVLAVARILAALAVRLIERLRRMRGTIAPNADLVWAEMLLYGMGIVEGLATAWIGRTIFRWRGVAPTWLLAAIAGWYAVETIFRVLFARRRGSVQVHVLHLIGRWSGLAFSWTTALRP